MKSPVEAIGGRMHTEAMKLSADQIVCETRDWPEDAIADLMSGTADAVPTEKLEHGHVRGAGDQHH
jgi:hypothetical protein